MNKNIYSIKPMLITKSNAVNFGSSRNNKDVSLLGRLAEYSKLRETNVNFDLSSESVFAIFGQRGTGKTYTLSVIAESLCTKNKLTSISSISKEKAILLLDTLNNNRWMNKPLNTDSEIVEIKKQSNCLKEWKGVKIEDLEAQVFVPKGYEMDDYREPYSQFRINISDMEIADFASLLDTDLMIDPMGQLLFEIWNKVRIKGWKDERGSLNRPKNDYSISDLINCLDKDHEIASLYTEAGTRRAVKQRLTSIQNNEVFSTNGTSLKELLKPGVISILLLKRLPFDLRSVLVAILSRRIMKERGDSAEKIKNASYTGIGLDQDKYIVPPTILLIDEAQNIFPSGRHTLVKKELVEFTKMGRNFGLSLGFTTQQPTIIEDEIMSQVDTLMVHQLTTQKELDYIKHNIKCLAPQSIEINRRKISLDDLIRNLEKGQAIVSSGTSQRIFVANIRPRVSVHGGGGAE